MDSTKDLIERECEDIKQLLIAKNKAYGDSVLNPVRIFSNANPEEQINIRIDDKLSRIARGKDTGKVPEDTVLDLIGYLVLLRVLRRKAEYEKISR